MLERHYAVLQASTLQLCQTQKAPLEQYEEGLDKIPRTLKKNTDPEVVRRRQEFDKRFAEEHPVRSRIFVGNLNHTITHKTLARVFKVCGPVAEVTISCFTYREDSTCFAEIIFDCPNVYKKAVYLDALLIEGRAIVICRKITETPEWKVSEKGNRRGKDKKKVKGKGKEKGRKRCSEKRRGANAGRQEAAISMHMALSFF